MILLILLALGVLYAVKQQAQTAAQKAATPAEAQVLSPLDWLQNFLHGTPLTPSSPVLRGMNPGAPLSANNPAIATGTPAYGPVIFRPIISAPSVPGTSGLNPGGSGGGTGSGGLGITAPHGFAGTLVL